MRALALLLALLLPTAAAALDPAKTPSLTAKSLTPGGGITCALGASCDVSGMAVTPDAGALTTGPKALANTLAWSLTNLTEINVLSYGPAGQTCVTGSDDTAAITNAVNAAIALGSARGAVVKFPRAGCKSSTGVTVPARKCILFRGEGMGASILRITGPSANGIDFNNDDFLTACGGVQDMSVESGAGFQSSGSFAAGSSGIGIRAAHMNNGWGLRNVDISGFGIALAYLGTWNTTSVNVHLRFFSDTGILIDKGPDGNTAGGNKIIGGSINNDSYAAIPNTKGIRIRASGGEWLAKLDITSVGKGFVADPRAGDQVAYLFMESVTSDTSFSDAWTFDGSAGNIAVIQCMRCWGAYSGNPSHFDGRDAGHPLASAATGGAGLVTIGPNLHGLRMVSMGLRENGLQGWDNRGGDGIELTTPEIHKNSQIANNTYPGVQIADGITAAKSFAIMGGSIGNVESGNPAQQAEAIKFLGTAAAFRIEGVDMSGTGPGKSYMAVPDETRLSNFKIMGNLPVSIYGLNASERTATAFGGFSAAGTTTYFEANGPVSTARNAPFFAAKSVLAGKIFVAVNTAPGAGQTFTYQLVQNGNPVGATGAISGASSFSTTFYPGVTLNTGDEYEMKVVGSSGAAAAVHRGFVQLDP